ncbi:MAG: hypothetical protein HRT74_09395, partial [Flavobacteriales bacterium]|nr:hypothetical protein [Flavobacteriales bacterium]
MRFVWHFVLLSVVILSCGTNPVVENDELVVHEEHQKNRYAKGFQFYENENEFGVILFDVQNDLAETGTWARLKPNGIKREGVSYISAEELTIGAQSTTQMAMIEKLNGLEHLTCAAYLS